MGAFYWVQPSSIDILWYINNVDSQFGFERGKERSTLLIVTWRLAIMARNIGAWHSYRTHDLPLGRCFLCASRVAICRVTYYCNMAFVQHGIRASCSHQENSIPFDNFFSYMRVFHYVIATLFILRGELLIHYSLHFKLLIIVALF